MQNCGENAGKSDLQSERKCAILFIYAIQNVFDATFYGLGKTKYMLFESIVTNSIYYGTDFILWKCGVWSPTLTSIALLFGIGIAFDAVVSFLAYIYLLKKDKEILIKN